MPANQFGEGLLVAVLRLSHELGIAFHPRQRPSLDCKKW
jgi:hypothetical protein